MREQTPCDVPGTSDHAWDVEQTRRDAEIDAAGQRAEVHVGREYTELDALRERRTANRMRARARAIAAGHPSAQGLSAGRGAAAPRRTPVDIHFAAPDATPVEQCAPEVSPPPAHLRTPPPPKGQI